MSITMTRTAKARNSSQRMPLASRVGTDGERTQEVAVLLGQLEPFDGLGALRAGEENARLGAALQDLLHGVAGRFRRFQRHLDGPQELLHEPIHVPVRRHAPTIAHAFTPPPRPSGVTETLRLVRSASRGGRGVP